MAANYQQGYTSPETEDILRGVPQQQDHGLWDVIGRAIHSLVPERPSDPAVGPPDAKQPFQQAGFFRTLLGDKSNELNLAARTGAQDRGIARGLATQQLGADIASENRGLANDSTLIARRGAMDRVGEDNRSVNALRNALTTGAVDQGYTQDNMGLGENYRSNAATTAYNRNKEIADQESANRVKEKATPQAQTPEESAHTRAQTRQLQGQSDLFGFGADPGNYPSSGVGPGGANSGRIKTAGAPTADVPAEAMGPGASTAPNTPTTRPVSTERSEIFAPAPLTRMSNAQGAVDPKTAGVADVIASAIARKLSERGSSDLRGFSPGGLAPRAPMPAPQPQAPSGPGAQYSPQGGLMDAQALIKLLATQRGNLGTPSMGPLTR